MNLRTSVLVALTCLGSMTFAAETSPCPETGSLTYPLGDVIQKEGLSLEFDFNKTEWPDYGSPAHIRQTRDTVLKNLSDKSPAERDALLLGRLSWSTIGTTPLLGITTSGDAGLFDTYLDVLERHGMAEHAGALKAVRAAFPVWNTSAQARYNQWNRGNQEFDAVLDAVLHRQSDVFRKAQPPLLDKAEDILSIDPAYDAYLDKRAKTDDWQLHTFMMAEIGSCLARYATPAEADAALA